MLMRVRTSRDERIRRFLLMAGETVTVGPLVVDARIGFGSERDKRVAKTRAEPREAEGTPLRKMVVNDSLLVRIGKR
jgi:hypothetical protein